MKKCAKYLFTILLTGAFLGFLDSAVAQDKRGVNDTLLVPVIAYNGDSIPFRELTWVFVYGKMNAAQRAAYRKWSRLRNAIYVTYPYAKKASYIFNEMNVKLAVMEDPRQRKDYIKSREQELKKEFADPLMKLSVYQGKVLMKLINRETHNTCYDIIKEYKGGVSARFWQTIAWLFGSSLKQDYNPNGQDSEMEPIVLEVARLYGYS